MKHLRMLHFPTLNRCQYLQQLPLNPAVHLQASGQIVQMSHSAEFCRDLHHQTWHSIKRQVDNFNLFYKLYLCYCQRLEFCMGNFSLKCLRDNQCADQKGTLKF